MPTRARAALRVPCSRWRRTHREAVAALISTRCARAATPRCAKSPRVSTGVLLETFEVDEDEFAAAEAAAARNCEAAMREAAAAHRGLPPRRHAPSPTRSKPRRACVCERVLRPIRRVGLYVPAGTAPLPSTALMLACPAQLAGCRGSRAVHAAAHGRQRRSGRAGRRAADAASRACSSSAARRRSRPWPTAPADDAASCDKLFGPGNGYVTEAKQQVAR